MPVQPRMRAFRLLAALAVLLGGVLVAFGCSPKTAFQPNLAPETVIFVQGDVDTVNHVVHLYWFGSDQDGFVTGYEVRFKNPAAPADTAWVFTERTDSVFTVFTPTGLSAPVFEVRSIDDDGARDLSPATQQFTFSNLPPSLTLISPPGAQDTTFASLTLSWRPSDIDGDVTRMTYLVWLEGGQDTSLTTGSSYTVPTSAFLEGGELRSGPRTVFIQPIDDGGLAGTPVSTTWYVRAPVTGSRARLLIIDDIPRINPFGFFTDTFFTNAASRNIPAGEWSLLRLEFTQPFDSPEDVRQTFSLFEAVIWYRGNESTPSPPMRDYQQGISDYLDAGGSILLEGSGLVDGYNAPGALSQDFLARHLGADRLFRHFNTAARDSSADWGAPNFRAYYSARYQDSLRTAGIIANGVRGFVVRDTNDVALWARAGTLSQTHSYDIPIAVTVPQPAGGRAVVLTVPIRAVNGFLTVPRFIPKMMEDLGILGP